MMRSILILILTGMLGLATIGCDQGQPERDPATNELGSPDDKNREKDKKEPGS